jgi:hypothetical protein
LALKLQTTKVRRSPLKVFLPEEAEEAVEVAAWVEEVGEGMVVEVEAEEDVEAEEAEVEVEDHPPADRESRLRCGQKYNWQCAILPQRINDSSESLMHGWRKVMHGSHLKLSDTFSIFLFSHYSAIGSVLI